MKWGDLRKKNSKTCVKRPLKHRPKILMTNSSLMKVKRFAEYSPFGAFCNTFDLHYAIICLEKPILGVFDSGHFTQVLLYKPIHVL